MNLLFFPFCVSRSTQQLCFLLSVFLHTKLSALLTLSFRDPYRVNTVFPFYL